MRTLRSQVRIITDTVRPRVVGTDGYAAGGTALHIEQQTVVALGCAVIQETERPNVLAVLRSLETQPSALIRVCRRGAGVVRHPVQCARTSWEIDRRVDRILAPDVCPFSTDVVGRHEPVAGDLPLQAQIPRRSIWRPDRLWNRLELRLRQGLRR